MIHSGDRVRHWFAGPGTARRVVGVLSHCAWDSSVNGIAHTRDLRKLPCDHPYTRLNAAGTHQVCEVCKTKLPQADGDCDAKV